MTNVGDNIVAGNSSWTFGNGVSESFDEHVRKSVPFYNAGHDLICKVSDYFVGEDSVVYELGSSTGELTYKLAKRNEHKKNARFVGIDIELEMTEKARLKVGSLANVDFIADDILTHDYQKTDFLVSYYTIQFTRPAMRQLLFDRIYERLNWGGAFVLFEKVRAPDARFQDIATGLYTDFKLEQGFNESEIVGKSRSLKGVLEPFSSQGNIDLLKRAGFQDYMTIMKYVCFEGFLAIK